MSLRNDHVDSALTESNRLSLAWGLDQNNHVSAAVNSIPLYLVEQHFHPIHPSINSTMSSKTTGGKGGKAKTSSEAKVLTTRSSKAGLQVRPFPSPRPPLTTPQFPVGRIHRYETH
jgi:hypothetical protein